MSESVANCDNDDCKDLQYEYENYKMLKETEIFKLKKEIEELRAKKHTHVKEEENKMDRLNVAPKGKKN